MFWTPSRMRALPCLLLITVLISHLTYAADWPCWRGPDGLAVSSETTLPTHWSKDTNIVWKANLPGKGASSPIVVGGRIYLTMQTADTGLHALAISSGNGEIVWDREVGHGQLHANRLHNMATPTAVSDG